MAQQTKSTHRAHCQVCGRLQAVIPASGRLAKHGYTVKGWGYFVGTCTGSGYRPIQQDRHLTDKVCTALTQHAEKMSKLEEAYRTGTQVPKTAQVRVAGKKDYMHIAWDDATELQRRDTVRALVWSCEREARHARAHVQYMLKLAEQVHGTDPLPIKKVERVAPVAPKVDTKAGTVSGVYTTKAARQADLDKLQQRYEVCKKVLDRLYLGMGTVERADNKPATELYYGVHSLSQWRPKHSAQALKLYPQSAEVVQEIEQLVRTREAVKNA